MNESQAVRSQESVREGSVIMTRIAKASLCLLSTVRCSVTSDVHMRLRTDDSEMDGSQPLESIHVHGRRYLQVERAASLRARKAGRGPRLPVEKSSSLGKAVSN